MTPQALTSVCFFLTNSIANSDKQSSRGGLLFVSFLLFVRFWSDCQISHVRIVFFEGNFKGFVDKWSVET